MPTADLSLRERVTAPIWSVIAFGSGAIVGLWIGFYPTWLSGFTWVQGDGVDTLLNHYFLEHSWLWLTRPDYLATAWSPAFFYPTPNVLAFGDNLWGTAPLYWLFRLVCPVDVAYSLWLITNCLLCYSCFWGLLRSLQVRSWLATLGAFVFGFGIPRITDLMHPQLVPQGFMILAFFYLWRFLQRPHALSLALCGLLTIAQFLAGVYLGWFWIWSAALFTGVALLRDREIRQRCFNYLQQSWRSTLALFLILSITLLGILLPYLRSSQQFGRRPYIHVHISLLRWQDWFTVPDRNLWSIVLPSKSAALPNFFSGMVLLLLSGALLWLSLAQRPRPQAGEHSSLVGICSVTTLTLALFSLRWPPDFLQAFQPLAEVYPVNLWLRNYPYNQSLWSIIYALLPGASAIRAVNRIWTVMHFYWLIAVLLGVDLWLNHWRNRQRGVKCFLAIVLAATLVEQPVLGLPAEDLRPFRQQATDLAQLLRSSCDIGYLWPKIQLTHPSGRAAAIKALNQRQLLAMWAGMQANVAVINGFSANAPAGFREFQSLEEVVQWLTERRLPEQPQIAPEPQLTPKLCLISSRVDAPLEQTLTKLPLVESPSGNFLARIYRLTADRAD